MRSALAVAALLPLLVGGAVADHVYSHRVIVQGRLVDGSGLPVPGVLVNATVEGEVLREACAEGTHPVTDEFGDFWFCYHKHAVREGARLKVVAGNASAAQTLDHDLRSNAFLLQDSAARGFAPENWSSLVRVMGRVWFRGETVLDGVAVEGLALTRESVVVSFGGESDVVRTDGYGDYSTWLRSEDSAGRVVARVRGVDFDGLMEPAFRVAFVDARLPLDATRPGSSPPAASVPLMLVFVAGAAAMVAWQSRAKGKP